MIRNRKTNWVVAVVLGGRALLAAPLPAQKNGQAEVLFERAVQKETVDGDLKAALDLYKQIVAKAGGNRGVAAKALVHMGQCYEKLGDAEARKAYERVVREFADQNEAVATARARLSIASRTFPSVLTARLITTNSNGIGPDSVTTDGRWSVVSSWTNGDLGIQDMATGQIRVLVPGTLDPRSLGPRMAAGRYSTWGVISPDQRQVAFARYGDPENPDQGQLWMISTEPGAKPRLVSRNPEYRNIAPQAWSPDGRSVLVHISKVDRSWQLAWASVTDGSFKVLKSFEHINWPDYWPRLSPDGRYIVYSVHARDGSVDCRIDLLAADGSRETMLTQTAGINASPVWTPDGTHVLFVSNRSGAWDLWSVPVRDGRAAGPASKVRSNIGSIDEVDMTRTGTLHYRSKRDEHYVSIADLPLTATPDSAARITETFVGIRPTWSPDGKSVAFTRPRPKGYNEIDTYDLVVHSMESSEEKLFSRPSFRDDYDGIRPSPAVWFGDSGSFLTLLQNHGRTRSLQRFEPISRVFKEVLEFNPMELAAGFCALAPDDKTLYLAGRSPEGSKPINRILALDLTTNRQSQVALLPGTAVITSGIHLSPDSRTFAFKSQDAKGSHLALMAVNGNDYRELYTDDPAAMSDLTWTRDGSAILFGRREDSNHWRIMRIGSQGGKPEPTALAMEGTVQTIDLNPKDSRIVLGSTKHISEFWALDNILAAMK